MSTIRDVASTANVSPGTVSLFLNGKARLAPETRQRIAKAMQDLDYSPKRRGRPSANGAKCRNIAMIVPGEQTRPKGRIYTEFIIGVRQALQDRHAHLSLFTNESAIRGNPLIEHLLAERDIDGIIAGGLRPQPEEIRWLEEHRIPLVVLSRIPSRHEFSFVRVDNETAGEQVADHLCSLGHRRLAFVSRRQAHDWGTERAAGFRVGVERNKAYLVREVSIEPFDTPEAFDDLCRELAENGVTGAFVVNDGLAIQCIDAAERVGIAVPEDLSVIGFDDLGYQSRSGLEPSSVSYDKRRLGEHAVTMLFQLLEEHADVRSLGVSLRTAVIDHDTTTPPPAK